jgi:hypothetical protein
MLRVIAPVPAIQALGCRLSPKTTVRMHFLFKKLKVRIYEIA